MTNLAPDYNHQSEDMQQEDIYTSAAGYEYCNDIIARYSPKDYCTKIYINSPLYDWTKQLFMPKIDFMNCNTVGEPNVYCTLNPIKFVDRKIRRSKKNVSKLLYLYVDLDSYNSNFAKDILGYGSLSTNEWKRKAASLNLDQINYVKSAVLFYLQQDMFNYKIPSATVVDSGRGLYLLWNINENIKAEPRWYRVQKYLYEQLEYYGADPAVVSDTARVFRVPGSINTKSGSMVQIISKQDYIYTLYDIMTEYCPYHLKNQATLKMEKYAQKIQKIVGGDLPNFNSYSDTRDYIANNKPHYSSNIYYINRDLAYYDKVRSDLVTLLLLHRDIPQNGKKELIMYIIRHYTLRMNNFDENAAEAYITDLNNRLNYKADIKKILSATKSANHTSKEYQFNYKKSKLLNILGITEDEMQDLRYLVSNNVKMLKTRKRKQDLYEKKRMAIGKLLNADRLSHRRQNVKYLYSVENKTVSEIANLLNVSARTIQRDLNSDECKLTGDNLASTQSSDLSGPVDCLKEDSFNLKKDDKKVMNSACDKNLPLILYVQGTVSYCPSTLLSFLPFILPDSS